MKKIISLVLAVLIALSMLTACDKNNQADSTQITGETGAHETDDNVLKILAVGNSFSNNTTEYLYDVFAAEGVKNVLIGRLYIGGCSLATHLSNADNNAAAYTYYKNDSGSWDVYEGISMLYALQDENWDIITMQQNSGNSGVKETYNISLDPLVAYVNQNKTNPDAKLLWHMTWAYQQGSPQFSSVYKNDQMTMYTMITETVQSVIVPNKEFDGIIHTGTAIQNARTSYIGDELTRDTYHLNDMGMIVAAYSWYATIQGITLDAVNLSKAGRVTLDDNAKAVIVEAVNNSIQTPFAVTHSANN